MVYLAWLKSKLPIWHDQGVINLAGSGVRSAEGILLKHMDEHRPRLEALLKLDYASQYGHPDFFNAIRKHHHLPPEIGILPAFGASSALTLVYQAMLREPASDRVLIESPAYDPLVQIPRFLGAAVDRLPRNARQQSGLDPDVLASCISPRTRLVVLTNLHNPSGRPISIDALRQAGEVVSKINPSTRILIDETFAAFLGPGHTPAATLGPQFISLSSLTKVYGLGSLRTGWILASGETFERIRETWLQLQNIGSRFTEAIACLVFENIDAYETHWREIVDENRKIVIEKLGAFGDQLELNVPDHGCICFTRLEGMETDRLLELAESKHKVGLAPGRFFDTPDHFRLGFGGDSGALKDGLDRLVLAMKEAR